MMRHATNKTDLPADRLFHFFQSQILSVSANLGLLGDLSHLVLRAMVHPLSRLPIREVNQLVPVMPKALRIAIILVFTPSLIATQAGTAQERSILMVIIST